LNGTALAPIIKPRQIMDSQAAIDLGREAMLTALMLGGPILAVGLLVGLAIGLVQALTQVQEQAVSFVPKLIAMAAALTLAMPWLLSRLVEYTQTLFSQIPDSL